MRTFTDVTGSADLVAALFFPVITQMAQKIISESHDEKEYLTGNQLIAFTDRVRNEIKEELREEARLEAEHWQAFFDEFEAE